MQDFENLSSILKNPQMMNLLQQFMSNNQGNNQNNNNPSGNSNSGAPNILNMQMISNLIPLLSNNNFMNLMNFMNQGNNLNPNNIQSIMMIVNLISQMQKNQNAHKNHICNDNKINKEISPGKESN